MVSAKDLKNDFILSFLEHIDTLVDDDAFFDDEGFFKNLVRLFFDKVVDELGSDFAERFGDTLVKNRWCVVDHVVSDAVDLIGWVLDGGRHRCFNSTVPVATDIDNQRSMFHAFEVVLVDDVVGASGVPQDAVDDNVVFADFFAKERLVVSVKDYDVGAERCENSISALSHVTASDDSYAGVVGEDAMQAKSVHNGSFAGDFVVAPKQVTSFIKHIFPSVGGQATVDDGIGDIAVLNGVYPTEDGLPCMELVEVVGVSHFRVADDVLAHGCFSVDDVDAVLSIVVIGESERFTVSGFEEELTFVFYEFQVFGNERASVFIFFM